MGCGKCTHRGRFHAMGRCFFEPRADGSPTCDCTGWSPVSNKVADHMCVHCKGRRGWDWVRGQATCWECFRDLERQGQLPELRL